MNFQTNNDFFLNEDDIFISSNFKTIPINTREEEEKRLNLSINLPNNHKHYSSYDNSIVPYSSNKYFSSVTIEEMNDDNTLALVDTNMNTNVSLIESIPKVEEVDDSEEERSNIKSKHVLNHYDNRITVYKGKNNIENNVEHSDEHSDEHNAEYSVEHSDEFDVAHDNKQEIEDVKYDIVRNDGCDDRYGDSYDVYYKDKQDIGYDIEQWYEYEYDYIPKFENSSETITTYSDYIYDIKMNEKCATCSLDALTLIKSDEEMFHKFLKTDTPFQISIFSLMKNIIQTLK
ncbi:hypothetical protein Yalta_097 [Yalta virus]|nr:hypothetical protein Yalta_097 [Yalta virus]